MVGKGFYGVDQRGQSKSRFFRAMTSRGFRQTWGSTTCALLKQRVAQAELAKRAGIEGFCYWHYWFAGKRLLERPFSEVLQSGEPDFPFCLGWANQTWTGIWHGAPQHVLIEQTYPGPPIMNGTLCTPAGFSR